MMFCHDDRKVTKSDTVQQCSLKHLEQVLCSLSAFHCALCFYRWSCGISHPCAEHQASAHCQLHLGRHQLNEQLRWLVPHCHPFRAERYKTHLSPPPPRWDLHTSAFWAAAYCILSCVEVFSGVHCKRCSAKLPAYRNKSVATLESDFLILSVHLHFLFLLPQGGLLLFMFTSDCHFTQM